MAQAVVSDAGRSAVTRLPIAFVFGVGVFMLLLLLGSRLLADPDTFWQIAIGNWIIDHGAVPRQDVFSFTMRGAPWISTQWLAQVLYAVVYDRAGWAGPVLLASLAIATAFALLARFLFDRLAPVPALILTLAALVLSAPHLGARPHVLALPVMVAWFAGLVRAADDRRVPAWPLLLVMMLWANLHGSFILGLALIAPIAADAVWTAERKQRVRLALYWFYFAVVAALAACITPYGPESILATLRILGLGDALSIISEWRPQDFGRLGAFELIVLIAIGFALFSGLKLSPIRIVIVLGLLHLALSHVRNAEVLGLLVPIFLATPLASQFGSVAAQPGTQKIKLRSGIAQVLGALLIAVIGWLMVTDRYRPDPQIAPEKAVAALRNARAERVLNDYDFGGFLIRSGIAPFIDGRTELYGENFVMRHHRAVTLQNLNDLLRLFDEYRIDATLLHAGTPAVQFIDRLDDWQRIYQDGNTVAHRRRAPAAKPAKAPSPLRQTLR